MSNPVAKAPPKVSTPKPAAPAKAVKPPAPAAPKPVSNGNSAASSRTLNPKDTFTRSNENDSGEIRRLPDLSELNPAGENQATPDEHFKYESRDYKDLTEAQAYNPATKAGRAKMTATDANDQINQDYHQINQDMQRYLAGDPNGPKLPDTTDWTSFGKYASREAGEQIRNTEDVIQAMNGDAQAATDLMRNGITKTNVTQGALVGTDIVGRALNNQSGDFAKGAQETLTGNPVGPLRTGKAVADTSADVGEMGADSLFKINKGLVKGNTEIHQNIAPAYDAFLKGESDGKGGLESLKDAGYYKGSEKDKQGFVSGAFGDYKKARELGVQAQSETDPVKKEKLLSQRQELMEHGNLMIGMQEQMEILQKPGIFEDKDMQRVIGASSGTMSLTDANGTHELLPGGGQWTDFQTRMGLKSVPEGTEGAIPVKDNQGKTTNYLPDPSKKGTIVDYFTQNASGTNARNLNQGSPRPVYTKPTTETGDSLDGLGKAINNGDTSQIVGNGLALGPRVVSDLTETASEQLQQSAQGDYVNGAQKIIRGSRQGGLEGAANQIAGTLEIVGGGVKDGAGKVTKLASDGLEATGDHIEEVADSYDNGVVSPFNENAKWWIGSNPFSRGGFLHGWGSK
jgi:hypothetical protein